MYLSIKIFTTRLLVTLMMVAPAVVYTDINAATITYGSDVSTNQVQTTSSAWITYAGLHHNTDALVNAIANSSVHGLNPDAYDITSLEQELESFVAKSETLEDMRSETLADELKRLEKRLDNTFSQFATDLGRGVLDAQKTQKNLYRAAPTVDTVDLLKQLETGQATVHELLAELTPSTPFYRKLTEHMAVLLEERDSGAVRTKVRLFEGAIPGEDHASLIDIRQRLKETGDLDPINPLGIHYSKDVEAAIAAVQARHGITETGKLNDETIIALNRTIDQDIEQVVMNLERWRWMPRDLGERHILVNVPSYNLIMMNGDQKITEMAVVVGSKEHNTPIFSEDAKFVEVAPTWTVPSSITNNEIIPQELRKPGYIDSERMDYYTWVNRKLVKVPRSQVTAADFQKKPFPYVLRQRAGKQNALGGIKVLMPNKYAIYMHDTQAKSLFSKTDRAYSHGCIRLSEPFRLGALLLQLDGKTPEQTKELLAKKSTTRIQLKQTTPTHIAYLTAWVDDEGKLNTRKDVYKNNESIVAALHKKNTLLSTLKSRSTNILAKQTDL